MLLFAPSIHSSRARPLGKRAKSALVTQAVFTRIYTALQLLGVIRQQSFLPRSKALQLPACLLPKIVTPNKIICFCFCCHRVNLTKAIAIDTNVCHLAASPPCDTYRCVRGARCSAYLLGCGCHSKLLVVAETTNRSAHD